jgi:ABC-type polysaccharide/polyol phosphate export permease
LRRARRAVEFMRTAIKEVIEYREFLKQYVLQTLRSRYRSSLLGFFWTLLNPMLTCLVLSIVFSYINRVDLRTYSPYFFSGYMPWMFFLAATCGGTVCVVGNAAYVTRIYLPKAIFPIAAALLAAADLLAALFIVFAVMYFTRAAFTPALLILPVSLCLLIVFCMGLCFLFGALNVFVRDFQFLWAAVTFLGFFFSPILYPLSNIPAGPRAYFMLNPLVPFLQLFQDPMSKGLLPPGTVFVQASIYAMVSLAAGTVFFVRSQRSFYLYL